VIEVDEVAKSFTVRRRSGRLRRSRIHVAAVDGISFAVAAGEFVGYLGPNGAGKSTTIKMLTGILTPSSGRVRVAGLDPSRQRTALARRMGVVFGQRTTLWWDLPLRDSLTLIRHLYRVERSVHRARLAELTELLELGPFLDTPVRQLSLGQRMRGDLAAALVHDPELLVLDEPTIGLDLDSKERLREFLSELNTTRGTTLLLTTHDLDDIERLCRRMMVIDRGRVLADGPLAELRDEVTPERVLVVDFERPCEELTGLPGVQTVKVEGGGLRQQLSFRRDTVTAATLISMISQRSPVHDVAVIEPDIDDVVRQLYRR
jgi:ABC-2 type transport system ATP-binding protein